MNRLAFSLVEVLMAIIVAALTLVPIIGVLTSSYGLTGRQIDEGFMMGLADTALNQLRATSFQVTQQAAEAPQQVRMDIRFPGEDTAQSFMIPFHTQDPASRGVELVHEGSSSRYFLKLELRRIATEADGVTSILNYGRLGFEGGSGTQVATFTAQYSTDQAIFVVWATVTRVAGNSEQRFVLTTALADLGT